MNITNEKEEITKYKELIYKLQLRDAIHRQEIKKLMEKNEGLDRKVKKLENGNRVITFWGWILGVDLFYFSKILFYLCY